MPQIIVKNYQHINSALPQWDTPKGKLIRSKSHYQNELAKSGMIDSEKVKHVDGRKEYVLSNKARQIIQAASQSKDKSGKVRLSDRTIDAMKSLGALGRQVPSYMTMPTDAKNGGFYATDSKRK